MTMNVVNECPVRARADAYMDLEDDLNVAYRQSRLAYISLEQTLGEVRTLRERAKRSGDDVAGYLLRQVDRELSAVYDAVAEVDAAAGRLERRYYAT